MLTPSTRPAYHSLLDAAVLTAPDATAPAIIYVETDAPPVIVSRAAFRQAVQQHAAALLERGIAPGDLVIIAHTQNLESIYLFWAALTVGAIPSMFPTLTEKLDRAIYMEGMAALVRLSAVKLVLTSDAFAPLLAGVGCPVLGSSELVGTPFMASESGREVPSVGTPFMASESGREVPSVGTPFMASESGREVAFLQHSSGTTGLQKGVALSHRAALNQLASYSAALDLRPSDVVVSWLPLYHDMGLIAGFLLPLVQGIPLVLMSPFEWVQHPALLFRAIHDWRGTLCWLPNFAYNHCARRIRQRDLEGLSAESMRMFINCSEPVHAESHQQFLERFAPLGVTAGMLAVSYAMAENTFAVTQTPPGVIPNLDVIDRAALESEGRALPLPAGSPGAVTKVSCGPAIAGTEVRAIDSAGQALPERQVGELVVRSNCMLTAYYKRPDLQPFIDGWYRTGDRGYLAGGEVYVIGRSKDLIINAGKNIFPQDIEAIVNTVPGIHAGRAVVFGVMDEREGTELVAVVAEVEADDPAARQHIGRALREAVSKGAGVGLSYVHLVGAGWLIKTSSGKIARAANRDKWLAERAP
jgi:acyl-CoA synthetase (AMP-forming)/AMP-acid ligase II